MTGPHDPGELAAHALGLLDGPAADAVQDHLAGCPQCLREWTDLRATSGLLGDVPPEMFLDGPPDGDIALQRALWQIRGETRSRRTRRRLVLASAAVVTAAALAGGSVAIGRITAEPEVVVAGPTVPDGTGMVVQGTDGPVALQAVLTPAKGWVRVSATVRGIPAGERCAIVVVAKDGTEQIAGSWVTGSDPAAAPIDGSAVVAPEDVAAIAVRNDAGREFISVAV
jgi:anti-sigma factor RsiW